MPPTIDRPPRASALKSFDQLTIKELAELADILDIPVQRGARKTDIQTLLRPVVDQAREDGLYHVDFSTILPQQVARSPSPEQVVNMSRPKRRAITPGHQPPKRHRPSTHNISILDARRRQRDRSMDETPDLSAGSLGEPLLHPASVFWVRLERQTEVLPPPLWRRPLVPSPTLPLWDCNALLPLSPLR
jgi:hypothetical protein